MTPTGRMITEPTIAYPTDEIIDRLAGIVPAERIRTVDNGRIATEVTGSLTQANTVLLGAALQSGALPVSVAAIERAIELNGVAIESNRAAVQAGRHWWQDDGNPPAATSAANSPPVDDQLARQIQTMQLGDLVAAEIGQLATDLIDYQNREYATRFLDHVAEAGAAELRATGTVGSLTETVATSMYKLMAYKDEYEVARLMLLPDTRAAAEAVGGSGASFTWHLHPPMLKAVGLDSKIKLGESTRPAFVLLAKGKRLRGTALDPFGRSAMRRAERALPERFASTLRSLYPKLTAANHELLVEIAALPDLIRGYEDLKFRRIAEYERKLAAAVTAVEGVDR